MWFCRAGAGVEWGGVGWLGVGWGGVGWGGVAWGGVAWSAELGRALLILRGPINASGQPMLCQLARFCG